MNKEIKQLIEFNEELTAGYGYSQKEKQMIFDLLTKSLMIDYKDYKKCFKALNTYQVKNCKTLIDCTNGIFLSNFDNNEIKEYILRSRHSVLNKLKNLKVANDNDWLRLININKSDNYCQVNKAIILYVKGRINEAKAILTKLAKSCDYFATILLIGMGRISNDTLLEAKYMLLFKRISNELFFENLNEKFENRFSEIVQNLSENDINEINSIKLSYDNEICTIGFY